MEQYLKINSIFKRDMEKPKHPFILGEFSDPAIEFLKDCKWEWTEKVDGTNIRILYDGEKITFKGKSDNADIPSHLFEKLQTVFLNDEMFNKFKNVFANSKEVCLYGEGFGYKIQGKVGVDYLKKDVDFYLFDVKIGEWWLKREDVLGIAQKLNLIQPFVVGYGTIQEAIDYVKNGFDSHFGTAKAEGLVLRPAVELFDRAGRRIITKIKTVDFKEI